MTPKEAFHRMSEYVKANGRTYCSEGGWSSALTQYLINRTDSGLYYLLKFKNESLGFKKTNESEVCYYNSKDFFPDEILILNLEEKPVKPEDIVDDFI